MPLIAWKISKNMKYNRIFNIGLPKTGTSSLHSAFQLLNIPSLHNPLDFRAQAYHGIYDFKTTKPWKAITNFGENFFAQLDNAYPSSKFILTLRDPESWLSSIERQISRTPGWEPLEVEKKYISKITKEPIFKKSGWEFEISNAIVRIEIFGTCVYNKDRFIYTYERHKNEVINYFKGRENDLLVMDIDKGDGWDDLCPFLDISKPVDALFPHRRPNPS
jgi:hypothetical protein